MKCKCSYHTVKLLLLLLFLSATYWVRAQGFEYFFDTDPGIGRGIGAPFSSQGDLFTLDIATATLSDGLHTLGVRAYNGQHWGHTFTKMFLKPSSTDDLSVSQVEYFFDTDPGIGRGIGAPFSSQGDLFTLDIATATLSDGLHTLGVRAYNGQHWGHTFTKMFLKPSSSLIPNIDRIEYYWDEDPGYGQGIQIPFTEGSIVEIDRYEVDTKDMDEGKHIFHIRASAGGVWTQEYTREVTINKTTALSSTLSGLSIRVYPLPIADRLTIGGLKARDQVALINISGTICITQIANHDIMTLHTHLLPSGVYLLRVIRGDDTMTQKLIK